LIDSFIRLDGLDDQFPPDMYIEFIAAARNYMPQLLAEIRLRRSQSH